MQAQDKDKPEPKPGKRISYNNIGEYCPPRTENPNQTILSSCRICLSSILDPVSLLVCGHSFCESCLSTYWKANEEPNFVICPLCRDYAFKIGFVQKKEYAYSTRDFRKKFDPGHVDPPLAERSCYSKAWLLVIPIIYLVIRLVKPFIMDMLAIYIKVVE